MCGYSNDKYRTYIFLSFDLWYDLYKECFLKILIKASLHKKEVKKNGVNKNICIKYGVSNLNKHEGLWKKEKCQRVLKILLLCDYFW